MKATIFWCILSVVVSNVMGDSEAENSSYCEKKLYQVCDVYPYIPFQLEYLESDCRESGPMIDCFRKFVLDCGFHPANLVQFDRIRNHFEEMCDNSTYLHQAVVDNLDCLRQKDMEDYSCYIYYMREDIVKTVNDQLMENGIPKLSYNESDTETCIGQLYFHSCMTEKVRKNCGASAEYVSTKLFKNMYYSRHICKEEILDYLPQIEEMLKESVMEVLNESKEKFPNYYNF